MNVLDKVLETLGLVQKVDKTVSDLASKQVTLEKGVADLQAEKAQLTADLVTANQTIGTLQADKAKADADHAEALKAKEDEVASRVEKLATEKSLKIAAGQGIPPIKGETGKADSQTVREQFAAIQDPIERGKFYAQHRDALLK